MPETQGPPRAAATRDAFLRFEGPLHPEDLAAVRHGGAAALAGRRGLDRASLFEGLLHAALDAARRWRGLRGTGAHIPGDRERVLRLRARALAGRAAALGDG